MSPVREGLGPLGRIAGLRVSSLMPASLAHELAECGFRQENRRQSENRHHHASCQNPSGLRFV